MVFILLIPFIPQSVYNNSHSFNFGGLPPSNNIQYNTGNVPNEDMYIPFNFPGMPATNHTQNVANNLLRWYNLKERVSVFTATDTDVREAIIGGTSKQEKVIGLRDNERFLLVLFFYL